MSEEPTTPAPPGREDVPQVSAHADGGDAPATGTHATHAEDPEILACLLRYRECEDRDVRNELIERFRWLAVLCANRFARRGEPLEDLVQVAQLGVLKAVERFDPGFGTSFATFAMPTVLGELKRHFRDNTWAVRVPRRLQELHLEYKQTAEQLTHELGRPPLPGELAAAMRVSLDEVLQAMEAGASYRGVPLVPPSDDGRTAQEEGFALGALDPGLESVEARLAVERLLEWLPERERQIVQMRFFEGMTQSQIAGRLGISQVHVSRLLRQSLSTMQRRVDGRPVARRAVG